MYENVAILVLVDIPFGEHQLKTLEEAPIVAILVLVDIPFGVHL